jgi:hypothetical protein
MKGGPQGIIARSAGNEDVKISYLTPLTMTFRGLDPTISPYPVIDLKKSGISLPINGVSCDEYILGRSGQRTLHCWLSPKQDFVIRRMTVGRGAHVERQTDIDYRPNAVCGWVPDRWVENYFSVSGNFLRTATVKVLEIQVNPALAPEQFDLAFPEGTQVHDKKTGKDYRVTSDGRMREVSATGENVDASVHQPDDSWFHRHQWLVVALGMVVGAMVVWLIMRRKKARSRQ